MARTSWLRCLVLDYGDDEQRAMLQLTPTTRTAKRARSNISHDAASTTTTTTLPDDTLVEIFSRLPSKSVGRFRCLSRSWAATLTSAPFVDLRCSKGRERCLCVSYGLGYSPATMEYKVARLFLSHISALCCEVFTLDLWQGRRAGGRSLRSLPAAPCDHPPCSATDTSTFSSGNEVAMALLTASSPSTSSTRPSVR
ncbi:hypothetical protein ACQ4PT_004316 [Festuca glaucescens]